MCISAVRLYSNIMKISPLVEQELPTLPEHPSSYAVFYGFVVARSLAFCVVFCRSLFVLCVLFFGHCIICPSIYGFWLPLCPLSFGHCIVCPSIYGFWLPLLVSSNSSHSVLKIIIRNNYCRLILKFSYSYSLIRELK